MGILNLNAINERNLHLICNEHDAIDDTHIVHLQVATLKMQKANRFI